VPKQPVCCSALLGLQRCFTSSVVQSGAHFLKNKARSLMLPQQSGEKEIHVPFWRLFVVIVREIRSREIQKSVMSCQNLNCAFAYGARVWRPARTKCRWPRALTVCSEVSLLSSRIHSRIHIANSHTVFSSKSHRPPSHLSQLRISRFMVERIVVVEHWNISTSTIPVNVNPMAPGAPHLARGRGSSTQFWI
jgi:hypothetical protein